jgi:hypothetical protein
MPFSNQNGGSKELKMGYMNVKEGDWVWIGSFSKPKFKASQVARITKTQIVLSGDSTKYWRESGTAVGYSSYSIMGIATDLEVSEYRAQKMDLAALFHRGAIYDNFNVCVSPSEHKEGLDLTFQGVTEDQIKEIASILASVGREIITK